ncbi:MAG: hypothetical protein EOM64_06895 [Erysipelotrichia bacterium]|nr:hypothetical protein [Erysipelotrichia bacterium]
MRERIPNRIRGTLWAKILSVFLLCIIGSAAVYAGSSWLFLYGITQDQDISSYLDSDDCWRQTTDTASMIVQDYIDFGSEYTESQYSLDYTNVHFTLYEKTASDIWQEVSSNDGQKDSVSQGYKLYYSDSLRNGLQYDYTYDQSTAENGTEKQYQINLAVTEQLNAKDEIYYNVQLFNRLSPYQTKIEIAIPVLLVLFAIVMIFLFCSVGHQKGDDQIHESWLEKIPYEIIIGLVCFICVLCETGLSSVLNFMPDSFSGMNFNRSVLCAILFLMLSGLSVLVAITTLAVRLKARVFWKSTLVGRICALLGIWLGAISIVPRTAVIAGIIMIIKLFMISAGRYELSFLADFIIAGYLIYRSSQARKIKDITHQLALGNLEGPIDSLKMTGIYREQAEDLNSIGDGMRRAVEQQMKSEHLKTELITNVSHDIKTPLTSVINYVDLLQKPHTEEEGKNYLEVLDRQSRRLKKLTEDVVEASKASSGNISAELVPVNVHEILEQSLAEYEDRLTAGRLTVIVEVKDEPIYVMADGRLLWRVLSNLFANLCKYALADTRVYLTAGRADSGMVEITVKNISREPLNISTEELMQRFVRGDASRHTEGSGLGLSIAESLTSIMKGKFSIAIDGDLFKAMVLLPETILPPMQVSDTGESVSNPSAADTDEKTNTKEADMPHQDAPESIGTEPEQEQQSENTAESDKNRNSDSGLQ